MRGSIAARITNKEARRQVGLFRWWRRAKVSPIAPVAGAALQAAAVLVPLLAVSLAGCSGSHDEPERVPDDSAVVVERADELALVAGDAVTGRQDEAGAEIAAPPGRWMPRRGAVVDPEELERLERLGALGYVSGSREASGLSGVSIHDPDAAHAGVNLYCSGDAPSAVLMDMEGNVLHRWSRDYSEVWDDTPKPSWREHSLFWRRVLLLDDGGLLAIFEGIGLIKLDRDSNLLWAVRNGAHHDLELLGDGRILVLTRAGKLMPEFHPQRPVLEDFVSTLNAEGRELSRVSILRSLIDSEFRSAFDTRPQIAGDLLHTNSLFRLSGDDSIGAPWYRAGNFLVSMRSLDLIAVLDPSRSTIVAAWKGAWKGQHDARILPHGSMLVFDNYGGGESSRVIQMDAESGNLQWYYEGSEEHPFFSMTCGTAQRLDNGNTLVTESDNGRAFEVDGSGRIVWEFHNPARAGPGDEFVAALFELRRLSPGAAAFLE